MWTLVTNNDALDITTFRFRSFIELFSICQTRPRSFSLAAKKAVSFLVFVFAYFFSPLEGGIVLEYRSTARDGMYHGVV